MAHEHESICIFLCLNLKIECPKKKCKHELQNRSQNNIYFFEDAKGIKDQSGEADRGRAESLEQ